MSEPIQNTGKNLYSLDTRETPQHPMSAYFGYAHIPNSQVRDLSSHFAELHRVILRDTPEGDMQDKALDFLWTAKNFAVASLAVQKEKEANAGRNG
ncbi:MAG: hypothetical protein K8953_08775 [Proteobacteria bacterium]|nr:hypothetical protein [Pseudomonadota bacterium]